MYDNTMALLVIILHCIVYGIYRAGYYYNSIMAYEKQETQEKHEYGSNYMKNKKRRSNNKKQVRNTRNKRIRYETYENI
jgi:hypothetical protein